MAKQFPSISDKHAEFIKQQKMFFVATATADSRINISPKGMDSLHIIDESTVAWLNVTGSGNETAAHLQTHPRMTIMFCAFEGNPMILRLYGNAQMTHINDSDWQEKYAQFEPLPGARQIYTLSIDIVQTSCGMAVPLFDYSEDRDLLYHWADKQDQSELDAYRVKKNQHSIDGIKIESEN